METSGPPFVASLRSFSIKVTTLFETKASHAWLPGLGPHEFTRRCCSIRGGVALAPKCFLNAMGSQNWKKTFGDVKSFLPIRCQKHQKIVTVSWWGIRSKNCPSGRPENQSDKFLNLHNLSEGSLTKCRLGLPHEVAAEDLEAGVLDANNIGLFQHGKPKIQ